VRWKNEVAKYKAAPRTFPTITDARNFLSRLRIEIEDGTYQRVDEGLQSFAPFAMRYLQTQTQNIKATTANKYETNLRVHVIPIFGERSLKSIRSIDVAEWVTKMSSNGSRVGTIRSAHGIMNQVMTEAVRSGLIESNPCAHTRFPRMARYEPTIITEEEANAIIDVMPNNYKAFVTVLAYCGLRYGEAAALRRGKVDLIHGEITVDESVANANGKTIWGETKTYERRVVSLPAFLVDALADHMEEFTEDADNSLVFTTGESKEAKRKGWIQNNNFHNRVWNPAINRLVKEGVLKSDVSPKDLRATCASWVSDDFSPLEAAKRLGHSNTATTTKHYARPIAGRDVAVAKRLDERFKKSQREIRVAS
jgi:integrase